MINSLLFERSNSVVFILGPELPEVDGCVAQGTEMQPCFFHFLFVHFVFAPLASVIISCHDGLATDDTRWEVGSTFPATGVILAHCILAASTRTFHLFARSLLWRVLGEDTHCHVNVFFALLSSSHSFKLHEGSRALFVTLELN